MSGSLSIKSAMLRGIEAIPVYVELSSSVGIPGMDVIGNPDTSVAESRSRVRCALKSSGFSVPREHITINLAPGELKKTGTGFDLALAIALLCYTKQMPAQDVSNCLFVGELGLSGEISPVRGLMCYQKLAHDMGLKLVCAKASLASACCFEDTLFVSSLIELTKGIPWIEKLNQDRPSYAANDLFGDASHYKDFSDVIDQEEAKRACVISAAGSHGMLMVGPPGAGKTMLAKRMPGILPPLSQADLHEARLIRSVVGEDMAGLDEGRRPFRAPHHSISTAGLIGGGRPVIPGEVSLAHKGVLFLDELPEFAANVLQSLRQPLEDKLVRLIRAEGAYVFPCDFMFLAAANPCPCGHLGDKGHSCICAEARIARYQAKLAGPLIDRIDICISVERPDPTKILDGQCGLSTKDMQEQVAIAKNFQAWRYKQAHADDYACAQANAPASASTHASAQPSFDTLRIEDIHVLEMDQKAKTCLESVAKHLALGGRAIAKIVRVARTIADLAEHPVIQKDDVLQASFLRNRKSNL